MRQIRVICMMMMLWGAVACQKEDIAVNVPEEPEVPGGTPNIEVRTVLTNQGIIWGFDVLPTGQLIYTQRNGTVLLMDTTTRATLPVAGLPTNISATGQGGLLDICLAPDFATSRRIYLTYSSTGNFLTMGHFTLQGTTASNWTVLHTTATPSNYAGHYGSRLAFGQDGMLYWAVGEGGTVSQGGAESPNQNGQLLNTLWGKVHRLRPDGTVPADNPELPGVGRTTIFTYGHRNPQGMAFVPGTNRLYVVEHGPSGGCELNRIEAGRNFGWPIYSNGVNYGGSPISNGHNAPGITAPLLTWTPALAPSGMTFINHPSYRDWNGNILTGSLSRRHLLMIAYDNGVPGEQTVLLPNIGRVRNVKQGPQGKIYVSVEDGGRLLELTAR